MKWFLIFSVDIGKHCYSSLRQHVLNILKLLVLKEILTPGGHCRDYSKRRNSLSQEYNAGMFSAYNNLSCNDVIKPMKIIYSGVGKQAQYRKHGSLYLYLISYHLSFSTFNVINY